MASLAGCVCVLLTATQKLAQGGEAVVGDAPGLEGVLDLGASLARQTAVVCMGDDLADKFVQLIGQALAQATAVDEDDGRACAVDLPEQRGGDPWPKTALLLSDGADGLTVESGEYGPAGRFVRRAAATRARRRAAGILTGHDDGEVQRRRACGIDHGRRACAAREPGGDRLGRPHRR